MDERDLNFYKKERFLKWTIVVLSLTIAALITGFLAWKSDLLAQAQMQEHLAQEVLRFHILANSDSDCDQTLKITVRDQVLDYLEAEMPKALDVKETKRWMRKNVDVLEKLCREIVAENGYDYPVTAAVTTCWFPDKTYGDVTFPAGNYEALRIEIGDAQGHNWWCVLYPNLCFLDAANIVVPEESKRKLQNVLSEEEYAQITTADFHIKSYFIEQWRK